MVGSHNQRKTVSKIAWYKEHKRIFTIIMKEYSVYLPRIWLLFCVFVLTTVTSTDGFLSDLLHFNVFRMGLSADTILPFCYNSYSMKHTWKGKRTGYQLLMLFGRKGICNLPQSSVQRFTVTVLSSRLEICNSVSKCLNFCNSVPCPFWWAYTLAPAFMKEIRFLVIDYWAKIL
jgi:hypothetical protein